MSIDDMKERILKTSRTTLNAKSPTTQATAPPTPPDGSRGATHRPLEPGAMAYHPPTALRSTVATAVPPPQTLHGGTTSFRIPKPSELFGIQPGLLRTPAHSALQSFPTPSVLPSVPHLPAPGLLSAASVTRQREHDRRLRSLSTKMQRANLKRRLAASQATDAPSPVALMGAHSDPNHASLLGGVVSGLRQWAVDRWTTVPSATSSENNGASGEHDRNVHIEFDTDVVDALVYTVGRWMGLDTEQLRDSPGLRTLVSRNIQWFRSSPDWMKLLGLVLAKKLNHTLECPRRSASDTQRMLLDRTWTEPPVSTEESEPVKNGETAPVTAADEERVNAPPAPSTKRPRTSAPSKNETHRKKPKKQIPSPAKDPSSKTRKVEKPKMNTKTNKAKHRSKRNQSSAPSPSHPPTGPTASAVFLDTDALPVASEGPVDSSGLLVEETFPFVPVNPLPSPGSLPTLPNGDWESE